MVPGILADVNCEGHVRLLLHLLNEGWRQELWNDLAMPTPSFAEVGLWYDDSDRIVWQKCQQEKLVLITINRNEKDLDSLQHVLRTLNTSTSLPIITIADADRFMTDRHYAENAADQFLTFMIDLEKLAGTGRLFIP